MQTFIEYTIMFLIVIGILIFFHELGHFLAARFLGVKVVKFSLGFGPRLIGRKWGETEYQVSLLPFGGYVKLLGEEGEESTSDSDEPSEPEDYSRSFAVQALWKRISIVGAGPVFNIMLAYIIYTVMFATGFSMFVPKFDSLLPFIDNVLEDSPAMEAGFKPGDKVLMIDEHEISVWNQMTEIIRKNPEKRLQIEVNRAGKTVTLFVTPARKEVTTNEGATEQIGQIGISQKMDGASIEAGSLFEAPIKGLEATWRWTELTVISIGKLITGQISPKNIGGPILIAQVSGRAAAEGISSFIWFIAFISINLGVINLLPVPVLDGGHLVFFFIEGIMGRPMNVRHREIAQHVGLYMLILLMGWAVYNDLVRWFTN